MLVSNYLKNEMNQVPRRHTLSATLSVPSPPSSGILVSTKLVSSHRSLSSFVKEPGRHLVCSSTNADVSYTKCIIMKVVHFNFSRFFSCFSILFNFIKRILFRSRQRKSSRSEDDVLPTLVTVASDLNHDQVGNFSVLVLPVCSFIVYAYLLRKTFIEIAKAW